jgi:hypothetical protein
MARNGFTSTTITSPEKVGNYAAVDNVSGAPSANTQQVRRPVVATATPVGGPAGHRDQAIINASSGQALADALRDHLIRAQRHTEAHLLGCTELGCCRA